MRNHHKYLLLLSLFFGVVVSCGKEEPEIALSKPAVQSPINPNGDSELALLMRAMFDEARKIKTQIENGEPVTVELNHEEILQAHATEPEKAASPEFKAYANLYLQSLVDLQSASTPQLAGIFENLVDNCMACHQAMCPGPMVKIKKLRQ
ncbi:hypothetical protein [Lewinella sp. W8]|uniref:hypothetical protein n=1 Tax=Lewinella sp. W8 TaxID=2528208 RepID=UPI0010684C3E|nr:hypothetical protein [Lewinella sp. W8]MTB53982.1 hypothetical protein [Lewinella sp. W8]